MILSAFGDKAVQWMPRSLLWMK